MVKLRNKPLLRFMIIIGTSAVLILVGYWFEHHMRFIETWIGGLGHWASLGYVFLFVLLTPLFVSVDFFCVIAGAIFNLPLALFDVAIATMIAAPVIYLIGTHLRGESIQRILNRHPVLQDFERLITQGGLRILFLIRLLPLPFAPTGYLFAVSGVRFFDFWISTCGILLYNSALTYFGFLAAHLSKQFAQGSAYTGPSNSVLIFGVLFCLGVILLIARFAGSEIDRIKKNESNYEIKP